MEERIHTFPQNFWILEQEGRILGFISGMTARQEKLTDEMYHGTQLYREDGEWLMIFESTFILCIREQAAGPFS